MHDTEQIYYCLEYRDEGVGYIIEMFYQNKIKCHGCLREILLDINIDFVSY